QAIYDALAPQDFYGTVVEQTAERSEARVVGSMVDIVPPDDPERLHTILADPSIRIVSLTITEGGYFIDSSTGVFDQDHPAIVADSASPDEPKTVFGFICAALKRRRDASMPPFTVMSCDNVPHNGVITRNAVAGLARLADADLADWIEQEVTFPNGMVDRITPATGARERDLLARDFGIEDRHPVFCEDYIQWVLEDKFCNGRPALEKVGVQFVDDVTPYENMKIRVLNGGHATLAYPAGLLDIEYAHDAMAHPLVRGFLDRVEREEIIPIVPPVPDTDLAEYYALVATRCENPKVADTIRRLCLDGSNRQPKFIIPSIADRLSAGGNVDGLALVSALWCRYCYGTTESGTEIEANDPNWDRLQSVAREARNNPCAWLAMDDVYGDVGRNERFACAFTTALNSIWRDGVETAMQRYIDQE
ncbi:MAG: mannitol dehydrogenase family protein, partial [Gammaproteobacteria bacterium]|nr:mannitol dehydrogenase family protein [Gammaproteobacteria bacterium]